MTVVFDADSLDEIDKTYQSIADLGVKLKAVREENSRHGQVIHCADNCLHTHCHSTLYSKLGCVATSQRDSRAMCMRPHDCKTTRWGWRWQRLTCLFAVIIIIIFIIMTFVVCLLRSCVVQEMPISGKSQCDKHVVLMHFGYWIGFCLTGSISLCLDSVVFMFVLFCVVLSYCICVVLL